MTRFRILVALIMGVALLALASALFEDGEMKEEEMDEDYAYGEPDGETTGGDVSSFVD